MMRNRQRGTTLSAAPFTFQRRIAWGNCDPARIYYTPWAVDYAVEAVEAWSETVLGFSWVELAERYALDARFVQIDCDYLRPLVASEIVHLKVWVTSVDHATVVLTVSGENGNGSLCYLARLAVCFAERKNTATVPIPVEFRQRIESYQGQCADTAMVMQRVQRSALISGRSTSSSPFCCSLLDGAVPFMRHRRVVYGDCCVSGILYAPRVFNYAIETVEEWYEEILGISWMDLVCKCEQGAPFVSVSCEYLQPIFPGQTLTVTVRVTRLGGASLGFAVVGYDAKGSACFDAHLAACFIEQDGFKTMRIPEVYRVRIQAYQSICDALEGDEASLARAKACCLGDQGSGDKAE
jgi:acyl-CoA thioesterase FadM